MTRSGVVATMVAVLLVLAGCSGRSAGSPGPDRARIGLDSVDGRVGELRLLSVSIASPGGRGSTHVAGNSAAHLLTVANDGEAADLLVGATVDVAERVVLRDGDDAAEPDIRVDVPAGKVAVLREVSGEHLELSGLQEGLRSGFGVPVTFAFRNAGSVTLDVPVRTYTDVPVDRVPPPFAAGRPSD